MESKEFDENCVDQFAGAMKRKLEKKREEGYGGWSDKELFPNGCLQGYLIAHLDKGDPVDIGNFAMMIWNRGESVSGDTHPHNGEQGGEWVRCERRVPATNTWVSGLTETGKVVPAILIDNGDSVYFRTAGDVISEGAIVAWQPLPQTAKSKEGES